MLGSKTKMYKILKNLLMIKHKHTNVNEHKRMNLKNINKCKRTNTTTVHIRSFG